MDERMRRLEWEMEKGVGAEINLGTEWTEYMREAEFMSWALQAFACD
jgi:hypothetical protein